jgi:nitrite reductase/ring-hydroxylating ferredoxin subunit
MATLDRRHALGIAAAAAVSPVLAACGDSGSAEGSGQSASAGTSGSATPGAVVASTADVPVGGGLIVSAEQLVVTQPKAGEFKAFSSICTHQKCPVTKVADGTIDCTCHGSKYSIDDGSVVNGPATKALAEKQVKVSGDSITLG